MVFPGHEPGCAILSSPLRVPVLQDPVPAQQQSAGTAGRVQDPGPDGIAGLPPFLCQGQGTRHQAVPGSSRGRGEAPGTPGRGGLLENGTVPAPQPDLLPEEGTQEVRKVKDWYLEKVARDPACGEGLQQALEDPVVDIRFRSVAEGYGPTTFDSDHME